MSNQLVADIAIVEVVSAEQAEAMSTFFKEVWGGEDDVVPFDLILALIHVGAYAYLGMHGDTIVAASFGVRGEFVGLPILHSHVTAATVPGTGYALKLHQRDWARERGIAGITWTFDPLVRRNCVFNFEKLGAIAVEYLPNFYGTMTDDINRGDQSDRLMAFWSVDDRSSLEVWQTAKGHGAAPAELARVVLPADIEALRKDSLEDALEWRCSVREQLLTPMTAGAIVSGMTTDRTALIVSAQ